MARTYRLVVGRADAGARLDRYLVRYLPSSLSRSLIQHCIEEGAVSINEQQVKPHRALRTGEVIVARMDALPPKPTSRPLAPQPIPLEIVYEDHALLVVNKPPGLVTHPAPGHWDGTLVNALLWHLQQGISHETNGARRALPRAGIVHRLDKDTSGLLLVAKTDVALAALSKQLKSRQMSRRYVALAEGLLAMEHGTINASIGRHPTHRKEMTVRHLGGRAAVSHVRVIRRVRNPQGAYTILQVALETGRTHQVRVHLAHLGHPLLGDTTYGRRSAASWAEQGIARQMLHAYQLSFRHPSTKRLMTLTAPVPDDMVRWLGSDPVRTIRALEGSDPKRTEAKWRR